MSIKDQIFEEFIEKLSNEKEFPKKLIEDLKNLLIQDEKITEKNIVTLIERRTKTGSENSED